MRRRLRFLWLAATPAWSDVPAWVVIATLAVLAAPSTAAAAAGDVVLVSRANGAAGAGANGNSGLSSISADGHRVAFETFAGNLTADGAAAFLRVFVRDLQAGSTVLAARASDSGGVPGAPGNGASTVPSLSNDGRVVAFVSNATNLSTADTDAANDVYVRELDTGVTELVSRAGAAGARGDDESYAPSVSGDGRYVAFASEATNLSDQDVDGVQDIYVRDRQTGAVTLVSRANGPAGAGGNGDSFQAAISADGRYVAFATTSSNLTADDASGNVKVLVRDLVAGTTTLVSRVTDAAGTPGAPADSPATDPAISADGKIVAFVSAATNLDGGLGMGVQAVYVRDVTAGTTTLASRGTGAAGAALPAFRPSISADGRLVAFQTQPGNSAGIRDRLSATTTLVPTIDLPRLAAGGGFLSLLTNQALAPEAVPFTYNVYRYDLGGTPGPANLTPPAVQGTAAVGQTLTCNTGTWSGAPTLTVEWLRAGTPITGAGSATYVPVADDAGQQIACRVTAVNLGGQAQATSAAVVVSAAAPPPPADGGPAPVNVERPTAYQADRLRRPRLYTCDEGTWRNVATPPGYTYEWLRFPVLGRVKVVATTRTYELPPGVSGTYSCVVTARNPAGVTTAASSRRSVLTGSRELGATLIDHTPAYGDVRVRGIDVFQIVQPSSGGILDPVGGQVVGGVRLPGLFPVVPGGGTPIGSSQTVPYAGVTLDATKPATAVVYVDMNGAATAMPAQRVEVTLSARLGGRTLSQTLTQTINNPRVSTTRFVTAVERDDPTAGLQFALPAAWLAARTLSGERLDIVARVGFPMASVLLGVRQCDGAACDDNDEFRLTGVPVVRLPAITIASVEMRGRSVPNGAPPPVGSLTPAAQVMARAAQLYPGGERFSFPPFAGSIDIGFEQNLSLADHECNDFKFPDARTCRFYYVGQRLERWQLDNNLRGVYRNYQILLGIHDYGLPSGNREPGWQWGVQVLGLGVPPYMAINSGTAMRPLTAAAHEFGHALGAPHAGQNCNQTRIGDPQQGEFWWPDDMGRLQGLKWDRTAAPTAAGLVDPVVDTGAAPLFDLMSYCGNESNAWLSAFNWTRTLRALQDYDTRLRSTARRSPLRAAADEAIAFGLAGPAGGGLVHVTMPDGEDGSPATDGTSPLRVRALDSAGQTLSEVGAVLQTTTEGDPNTGTFAAPVPATAAAVELIRDGVVLDRLERSAAPTVRLLAPAAGLRVRSGRSLTVRWQASDSDSPSLEATVDYSPDNGKSWRTVLQGPSTGTATLPASALGGGARVRVRVAVSDGFNEALVVSDAFSVDGNPPAARIVRPLVREPLRAGERTLLVGAAFDDLGRDLRGRQLTWFAGRRRLGTGERLTATLPAGRYQLRLVARAGSGRSAEARVVVRVAAQQLRLVELVPPPRVAAAARSAVVRVRTSASATLVVGGRRFEVGTAVRKLVVPLPARPRTGLLRIAYGVAPASAGIKGAIRGTFEIVRA